MEATVACGPNLHRLRWAEGTLAALDHVGDDDTVLAELESERPACLNLVRHWQDHATDGRLLTIGSRHPGDTVTLTAADLVGVETEAERILAAHRVRAARLGDRPDAGAGYVEALTGRLALLRLLALEPSLQRRLQQEVADHLASNGGETADALLEAAVVGRLGPIARRWAGPGRQVTVELGSPPAVTAQPGDRRVGVRVGRRWLADVWGRYLGAVSGFLVLDVARIVSDRAEVTGVAEPGAEPTTLTLAGPAPWRVLRRHNLP